jgi:PadR family transcriptional regulator, regulatory protein PadR
MNERQIPVLLPGTLYMMLLLALSAGPMHGYAIAKHIRTWSNGNLHIEDGSMYPALNRMLVKGWLTSEWGTSENNRRARFYRVTREGRKQLDQQSNAFTRMVRAIRMVMHRSQEAK